MAKETSIQWADSSLNLQAGCDGCELWNDRRRICYAGRMIDGGARGQSAFAGRKGWPASFAEPELFLDRLEPALKWADLTGTKREDKPWLDGLPRIIFLNDMGDTFSKKLPGNWMAPILPRLAESPHQFLLLTKRPSRLAEFAARFPLPPNVWPGTSVTSDRTAGRVEFLRKIKSGGPKFVSCEPLWSELPAKTFEGMQWAIFGGESGDRDCDVTATDLAWLYEGAMFARQHGAKPFIKQLGSRAYFESAELGEDVPFTTIDGHGGEWNEWPMALRIREMPSINFQPTLL